MNQTKRRVNYFSALVFAASCNLISQSVSPATQLGTFHVHGSIARTSSKSAISGATVTFEGQATTKTVFTGDRGTYETDLPLGTYSMTVRSPDSHLEVYERPRFRVMSPTDIVFDISLDIVVVTSCDTGYPPSGKPPDAEDVKDGCGGAETFTLPSEDNVQLQMLIRFAHRSRKDHLYAYSDYTSPVYVPKFAYSPVFVAYNLFSLRADQVLYDTETRVLHALGNVVIADGKGHTERTEDIQLRVENGQTTRVD